MTNLISLAITDDAEDGAPLVFDKTAPGRCRWANDKRVEAIASVPADVKSLILQLSDQVNAAMRQIRDMEASISDLTRFRDVMVNEAVNTINRGG